MTSSNNPTSILASLEMLESASVSSSQVPIIGGTVNKMARTTKNPNIAEIGGMLSYCWGVQSTLVEEDEEHQNNGEDQEDEECQ